MFIFKLNKESQQLDLIKGTDQWRSDILSRIFSFSPLVTSNERDYWNYDDSCVLMKSKEGVSVAVKLGKMNSIFYLNDQSAVYLVDELGGKFDNFTVRVKHTDPRKIEQLKVVLDQKLECILGEFLLKETLLDNEDLQMNMTLPIHGDVAKSEFISSGVVLRIRNLLGF